MAAKRTCEECGAELPANAPQGLCPQCLARVAAGFASPVAATPHPDPKSGLGRIRYFGDYELLNEIARGGMGVVYRARQSSLNRVVAVKMLLFGKFASDEFVKRFHREAEAAASLQHANIVAVHEVGEHEGQHYFSMDYVAGKDLGELTRGNPLPARRAAGYLKTIAEAIHFAHQRGILHRDVKPSNVLIDEFDQPRITDFGLAKQLKGDPELTTTGQVLGSPNYMPPEQAEPRRGEVNAASDVYSLGAILYHLLTGRPPFLAETLEDTLRQLLNDEPVAPSRLNASVPRDLETICLKCLEKGPRRRYGSAHELADDLSRWLKGEPIHARPVTVLDRAVKWTKRQPAIAALAVSVLLLLIVVAVGSTIAAVRLERARRQTTEKLYDSYIAQARANRLSGRPGRYFDTMETIAKAVAIRPSLELRNEAIASFTVEDLRLLPLGETNPPSPGGIIFSSTLELFARVRADGDIAVRRVKDKQAVAVVPAHELGVRWLHGFTDDGRFLAFHTDKAGHCIWDIQERRMIFENLALTPGGGLVFLSQEDSFASVESDGAIAVYELKSRHMTRLPAKVSSGSGAMAFHSSSSRLACFNARMKLVEVVNLRTAELESSIKAPDHCEAIVWSDDGKKLAAASSNRRAYIWDAKSGELLQTCVGHDELITKLAFNHASTLLATTSWDDTTRLWDPMSGAQLLRMTGSSYQLQFSADDQRLGYVVQGARFGLLEVATHPEYRCLAPARRNGRGGALAVGPDSRLVAGLVEGRVCLWDFESGQEMGALREAGCASVFFDHDGDGLITCGLAGAAHWTIQRRTETNTFQIGDRRALIPEDRSALLFGSMTADGNVLATVQVGTGEARVIQLAHPEHVLKSGVHPGMRHISISPDGKWVATGTWNGTGIKIWNGESGALVRELPEPGGADVLFSPDGRWLVTGGAEYHLWEVGTWRPGPPISQPSKNFPRGVMAFSPDSRVLAISSGGRAVRLSETKTARTLADIESPLLSLVEGICFSPDGTKLLAADGLGQVHIWDLRLIRQRLAAMKLDWD